MTPNNEFISPFLLGLTFVIIGCANHSGNGISEVFKENYLRECRKNAEVNLSASAASEYCNCTLGMVIEKFDSDQAAEQWFTNLKISEIQEFVAPCAN